MIRARRRLFSGTAVLALVAVALVAPQPPPAVAATISSTGPLTSITVSQDLNCDVRHELDALPEWFSQTACGTFASLNGTLYGPVDVPAGSSAAPRTGWTRVSQSPVTGSGAAGDPYTVVTVVQAGATGVTLTQTDTYVVGNEFYSTSATLSNGGSGPQIGTIYTAGDCYLQSSDSGYGRVVGTAPACTTTTTPGGRVQQLLPITGGNAYYQANYGSVWSVIGQQRPFPDTCLCGSYIDNGIGISWPLNVPAGGNATYEWSTVFSPTGDIPLIVTATADQPSVLPGANDGYTIQVANGNVDAASVDELVVTLPDDFAYVPGSTTGVTTADPVVSGQTLTFAGPFDIPAAGVITLHLGVVVGATPGTFTIDATAASPGNAVNDALNAAPITVLAVADLSVAKVASQPTFVAGGATTSFTITATNNGPGVATDAVVTDTLPSGLTFVPAGSSSTCFSISGVVTCGAPTLAPGESAVFTVNVATSASATAGARTNTAAVASPDVGDTDLSNNTGSAAFSIVRESDVSVTKTGPATVPAGGTLTYTITLQNAGPSVGVVTMTDILPVGVSATSISGTGCSLAGGPRCSTTVRPAPPSS